MLSAWESGWGAVDFPYADWLMPSKESVSLSGLICWAGKSVGCGLECCETADIELEKDSKSACLLEWRCETSECYIRKVSCEERACGAKRYHYCTGGEQLKLFDNILLWRLGKAHWRCLMQRLVFLSKL